MDPLRHPDLVELSRRLRRQLETVLQAEQEAAAATLRRRRSLRDRLLEAEDADEEVTLHTSGRSYRGVVRAVGADHVMLKMASGRICYVALDHCLALEACQ